MNTFVKWKTGQILEPQDISIIIQELYNGAKKKLCYDANEIMDQTLARLYQAFKSDESTDCVLRFSSKVAEKPFISTGKYDDVTYELPTSEFSIFVYE